MADFLIRTMRGGQNEDPPTSIADDQGVVCQNVEWYASQVGDRRLGSVAITLDGGTLAACDRVTALHRHLPTSDQADAELWALGVDGSTPILNYKDTAWNTVTTTDAITVSGAFSYQVAFASLHTKLFIAHKSGVDRLHVRDADVDNVRRAGLAAPAAPTGANSGSGSLPTTERLYRVRYTVQASGVTVRRSEPSDSLSFEPSGSGEFVRITKPPTISESETHWELELNPGDGNWYRIATTAVGTTTYDDDQSLDTVATDGTLSEDSGDYENIWSARYLTVDEDRLVFGGSFEDADLASRVGWTPVFADPGVGNDERIPVDTVNYVDLDNHEGGDLTGLSGVVNGYIYAFKFSQIYRLARQGVRTKAYNAVAITKKRGALPGSVVEAFDNAGNPIVLFLDPDIGPCLLGARGAEPCGADLIKTWETINLDASKAVSRGIYFPEKQQVHWWVATDDSDVPDLRLVLHVREMRWTDNGYRRGWAVWTGQASGALAACMFAANVEDDAARSLALVPFVAVEGNGLIWQTEVGDDDNGTDYHARLLSKPFVHGNILHKFACKNGALIAKAAANAVVDVTVIPDFGADATAEREVAAVDLSPAASEPRVIRALDDLSLSAVTVLQVEIEDPETPGTRWEIDMVGLKESRGQTS